jgi:hypothetical protein
MTPATNICRTCKFWFSDAHLGFSVGVCVGRESAGRTRADASCGKWKPRRARVARDPARAWGGQPGNQYSNPVAKAGSGSFHQI